jgi:UV DNA damage endonuclease
MIQRTIKETGGLEKLKDKIIENCKDLIKMIEWNEQNGIKVFRISSNIFPHKTNPNVENYDLEFARDLLKEAGDLAKKYNQRITMHPGQYNVVGTPNENAFKQTILDLEYQASILDLMEMDENSVMVVHGGGIYGDKNLTKERWCRQFYLLPENVQRRLVLENCEKCFSIKDCLDISRKINIPVVLDTHHYYCYNLIHNNDNIADIEQYIPDILDTWIKKGIKPKFHVSEQGSGKCGHHSDYIEEIPYYLLEIPNKYKINIDIMIEAKKKELAIFKLYKKYPKLDCKIYKKKIKIIKRKIIKRKIIKRKIIKHKIIKRKL